MQSLYIRWQCFRKFRCQNPQSGSRCARIVDCMFFLSGALWIYTDPQTFSGVCSAFPKLFKLRKRIEYQMLTICQHFFKFIFPICRRKNMIFFAHTLFPKLCFIQAAGSRSIQIFSDERITGIHRKCFLCQQNLTSALLSDFL